MTTAATVNDNVWRARPYPEDTGNDDWLPTANAGEKEGKEDEAHWGWHGADGVEIANDGVGAASDGVDCDNEVRVA